MNTRIICGSTHGAWDEYGAHCSVCHLPDPRDAEIAALRARAEKAERRADDAKVYAQQMADRGTCGEIQAVGGAMCGACRDCFAEQTARVEKIHHALLAAESRAEKAEAERDAALAACAEMRAALECAIGEHEARVGECCCAICDTAKAALSRPDLGAGMAVVTGPLDALVDNLMRVVCDCHDGSDLWAHTRRDPEAFRRAVRDALLKKGGG